MVCSKFKCISTPALFFAVDPFQFIDILFEWYFIRTYLYSLTSVLDLKERVCLWGVGVGGCMGLAKLGYFIYENLVLYRRLKFIHFKADALVNILDPSGEFPGQSVVSKAFGQKGGLQLKQVYLQDKQVFFANTSTEFQQQS